MKALAFFAILVFVILVGCGEDSMIESITPEQRAEAEEALEMDMAKDESADADELPEPQLLDIQVPDGSKDIILGVSKIPKYIFKESGGRVGVANFKKVDEKLEEFEGGVPPVYTLWYKADAAVLEDCWSHNLFIASVGWPPRISFLTKKELGDEDIRAIQEDDIDKLIQRVRGDRTQITGSAHFAKDGRGVWNLEGLSIVIGSNKIFQNNIFQPAERLMYELYYTPEGWDNTWFRKKIE